jgi:BioD-like phosphotransacetylase family protein
VTVLYIASTDEYSGKTGVCLSLGLELQKKGKKVGFMKPLGSVPGVVDGQTVDLDAYYITKRLDTKDNVQDASPIALTRQYIQEQMKHNKKCAMDIITSSFSRIVQDKDVVIMENGKDVDEGRFICASAPEIAETFDAKVLLVSKYTSELIVDDILGAKNVLGEHLLGVIFNQVPMSQMPAVEAIKAFLKAEGIKCYGSLPRDRILQSVTVKELADHLNGTILTAAGKTDELVENFMVGAMGQERALRFFQRVPNKAVITGGDRSDVQLAALETQTKALILTGNLQPSPIVMARAEDLQIPMILVNLDTLAAVEKTDEIVGRVRIHQAQKVQRFMELIEENVDLDLLFSDAGINI